MNETDEITVPAHIQENWQQIVDILAQILELPAALIMRLNGPDIEVFAASRSRGNPYHPGDREHFEGAGLYCETVIKTRKKLLVPDSLADEHWKDNPDIKLNMVSYLGFPLFWPQARPFGTLCVLDTKRNAHSALTGQLMEKFKSMIESQLELIHVNQSLGDRNRGLQDYLEEIRALRGLVSICANCKSIKDPEGAWHPVEYYLSHLPEASLSHGICPACMRKLYPDVDKHA